VEPVHQPSAGQPAGRCRHASARCEPAPSLWIVGPMASAPIEFSHSFIHFSHILSLSRCAGHLQDRLVHGAARHPRRAVSRGLRVHPAVPAGQRATSRTVATAAAAAAAGGPKEARGGVEVAASSHARGLAAGCAAIFAATPEPCTSLRDPFGPWLTAGTAPPRAASLPPRDPAEPTHCARPRPAHLRSATPPRARPPSSCSHTPLPPRRWPPRRRRPHSPTRSRSSPTRTARSTTRAAPAASRRPARARCWPEPPPRPQPPRPRPPGSRRCPGWPGCRPRSTAGARRCPRRWRWPLRRAWAAP
jgi:hypothetical protein